MAEAGRNISEDAGLLRAKNPLPGFLALRKYNRAWLWRDLLAGIVIFAVTIPPALAYGSLAGLKPVNGLYASLLAMGLYGLLGTSRQLIVDAEAAVAILVASSVASIAAGGDPGRFAALAMMQAILVGAIQVIAGAARIGFIADFIPKDVIIGFLNGIALIIILAQMDKILGIHLKHDTFFARLTEITGHLGETNWPTLKIGIFCLVGLFLLRRLLPKIPEALLVVALATLAVYWWKLGGQGVKLVGEIPAGLPHPGVPKVDFGAIKDLLPVSAGVALVSFVDTIITGRAFAMRGGYKINASQEMIALGVVNMGTGFCQGFAVGSSHSRTAINDMYGGKSQLAGLLAAGFLALFLMFFTSILENIPQVALAAVIIVAAVRLFDFQEITKMFKMRQTSAYLAFATTLAVLIFGLMNGILVAVSLSIILVLHGLARPHDRITGRPRVPGLMVYRFAGPLLYFNVNYFINRVRELISEADPPVTFFLVNGEAISDMDLTAARELEDLHRELKEQNIVLAICEAKGHFREMLKVTGMTTRIGGLLYRSVAHAVKSLEAHQ